MPWQEKRKQLLRRIAAYNKRLERLYDDYIDRLAMLDYGEAVLERDALFNFDNFPELAGELEAVLADFVNAEVLTYRSAIQSAVSLAYTHDNALLSGVSVLDNAAVRLARESAAAAFIRGRMNTALGLNLSQMVWNYARQARGEFEVAMSNVITDGLQRGTSAAELGRRVRQYLNAPDMMWRRYHEKVVVNGQRKDVAIWRKRVIDEQGNVRFVKAPLDKVGTGVYRSARKNAERLMRSEINMAYHRANHDRWMQEPFVIGQRIALSPQHPHYDICDELAGDYPKEFLFIGWHPQCLCMSNPITLQGEERKDYYRRLANGEDMSGYVSPNRVKDVPQRYKEYVAAHAGEIVSADRRGKLAWHFQENQQFWEGITENTRKKIESREALFRLLQNDPNYIDVAFSPRNGGLKATHLAHNFDKKKGNYEREARDAGYREGHAVILEREDHTRFKVKNTEGTWDGMAMEIAAAETCTSSNIRNALKHCASKPGTEVAVILLADRCDWEAIHVGLGRYNGLRGTGQWREFKDIVFVNNGRIRSVKSRE